MTNNPWIAEKPVKKFSAAIPLLVFLGVYGGHRFYLDRNKSATVMLILSLTIFGVLVTIPWVWVDSFLLARMVDERNTELVREWDLRHHADPTTAAMARTLQADLEADPTLTQDQKDTIVKHYEELKRAA
jgi:TM2 domain-containing membrane protein YozV